MEVTSYLLGKKSGGGGTLQEKSVIITENGTTNITADSGYDGLSKAVVTTNVSSSIDDYLSNTITFGTNQYSGWLKTVKKLPSPLTVEGNSLYNALSYFQGTEAPRIIVGNNVTTLERLFLGSTNLTSVDLTGFDTSNVTNMNYVFNGCSSLQSLDLTGFDTSNVTTISGMFDSCSSLVTLNLSNLNFEKINMCTNLFYRCLALENLTFGNNLGKGYLTTASANYNNYKLDLSPCTKLTHDSLMSVINNLYDIASAGVQTQKLVLGSTNLAKLSQAEQDIVTAKGWTLS